MRNLMPSHRGGQNMSQGEIKSVTLGRLTADGLAIQQMLEESEDRDTLQKALDSITAQFITKVENIGYLVKDWEYSIEALKAEEERLSSKRKSLEQRLSWLKDYTRDCIVERNDPEFKDGYHFPFIDVKVASNPPSVEVVDESAIPATYVKIITETKVDKKAIIDYWKKSNEVPAGVRIITDRKRLVVK